MPESLFARVPEPQACKFIKKETLAQIFHLNFSKLLRTAILMEHFWWLFLMPCNSLVVQTLQSLKFVTQKNLEHSRFRYENANIVQLQSCSKYFETFWWLNKFSFHHKWNKMWLLVKIWYVQVAEQLKN